LRETAEWDAAVAGLAAAVETPSLKLDGGLS
jgi:hypothetical protein